MASSKRKNFDWNIETTKLLISLYEEHECLYNNLHSEYKNRDKRLSIMTNIAKLISDTTGRVCLVADIRKKINSLRSQYLAEKLKITKCKSGSGGDYTPTAYWFPLLRFMDISTEADASQSNLDIETPRANSDNVDTQQTHEEETEHPNKQTKKKKKKLDSTEDEDALIREATATMRQMSQHITSNSQVNSDINITAFCNFVNSELTSILRASNNNFVNKAKRKIQMCLFDIWDEIEAGNMQERLSTQFTKNPIMSQNIKKTTRSVVTENGDNMHKETPSTQSTNYSENSLMSKNIKKNRSVVTGNASSLVIKRNDSLTYNSPQENDTVEISTGQEDNIYETVEISAGEEDHICVSTQNSKKNILYYINSFDPEKVENQ